MDRDQSRFLKQIMNAVMHSAINRSLWRLPLWATIAIGLIAAAGIWHFKLF